MASNDQDYTSGMMGRSGLCHPVEVGLDELTRLRAIEEAAHDLCDSVRTDGGRLSVFEPALPPTMDQSGVQYVCERIEALRAALDTKP